MKKNNKTNKKIKKKKGAAKNFKNKQTNKTKIKTAVQFKELSQLDVENVYSSLNLKEKNLIPKSKNSFFRLGVQVNNKIVAYAELKKIEESHGQLVFAVLEDYRGNGFAKILAMKVIQMAPIIGIHKITYIPVSNKTREMVSKISKQFQKVDKNKYEINFKCC